MDLARVRPLADLPQGWVHLSPSMGRQDKDGAARRLLLTIPVHRCLPVRVVSRLGISGLDLAGLK